MAKAGVLKVETALALRQPLFANTPELGAMLHGFFDLSASRGRSGFGHGGALVFQKSTMEIYPDEGFAIFISANTPAGGTLLDKLPPLLLDLAYPRRRHERRTLRRKARRWPGSIADCASQPIAARRR